MTKSKPPTITPELVTRSKRISKAVTKMGGYKGASRWFRAEFDERIAKVLPVEDPDAAWLEYLNVEHGHFWFYDDETDSWEHE